MSFPRTSGVLLHPTSLPSRFGIGDLGVGAYQFADFLAGTGQHLWQLLPLGPVGYGNSPYQCLSVFAGNPLVISPERLIADELLERADANDVPCFSMDSVDYETVTEFKRMLLKKSFQTFERKATRHKRKAFEIFCQQNAWLEAYALFMALKEVHGFAAWNTWEEDIRTRHPESLERWRKKLDREIRYHKYQQYLFFEQWSELRKCCNDHEIKFIGDVPMFVALDSVEVWLHPEMFYLDDRGKPIVVAGVPPDYFSRTGQLWGNPLYRWNVMAKNGYAWWIERLRAARNLVDIIRLDHFRGFEKYWEVPATDATARNGSWVPGPGARLFDTVQKALGSLPIIAEDLGVITPEVKTLREQFGFPSMRVLQFAFGSDLDADDHRPNNYPRNCVVYTGTHDNDTTIGWFRGEADGDSTQIKEERQKEKQVALNYLGTDGHEINWDFIRLALMSAADTAIIPMQDVLGLGNEARMNLPGRAEGNWCWRFRPDMLTEEIKTRLKELTALSGR